MVIGVVGMGLIGGSLVKAIKKNTKTLFRISYTKPKERI